MQHGFLKKSPLRACMAKGCGGFGHHSAARKPERKAQSVAARFLQSKNGRRQKTDKRARRAQCFKPNFQTCLTATAKMARPCLVSAEFRLATLYCENSAYQNLSRKERLCWHFRASIHKQMLRTDLPFPFKRLGVGKRFQNIILIFAHIGKRLRPAFPRFLRHGSKHNCLIGNFHIHFDF